MTICWTGTFDPSFERNRRLRRYLEAGGNEIHEVRANLWPRNRIAAFENGRLSLALRMAIVYPTLLIRLLSTRTPDIYLVSYPGWFDVPVVKLVSLLKRRPIVFDIFISLYDTAIEDRQLANPDSVIARVARLADKLAMRLSDRVISDCPTQARFLADLAALPVDRFGTVYIGADEAVFHPQPGIEQEEDLIVFYGSFVPLQGTEWIIRAAALLEDRGYRFRVIGEGQDRNKAMRLAKELKVTGIDFVDYMPPNDLAHEISRASLCLGIFGTSRKADRVIPHKVFEALACGRPVLTGDTAAINETLDENEVATCPVGDPEALAERIDVLMRDSQERMKLARMGYERFQKDFSLEPQTRRLGQELQTICAPTRR